MDADNGKQVERGEGICTSGHEQQCQTAHNHSDECTCSCGGVNHGSALKKVSKEQQDAIVKKILGETSEQT